MSDPNRNESSYSEKPNSSDLIYRQAAIDAVRGRFSMPVDNLIVEVIGNLPSVQPEQTKKVIAMNERGEQVKQMTREKTGIFDKNGKEICVGDVVHYRGKGMCAHGVVTKHDTYGYAIDDDRPKTKGRRYDLHNEGVYRIEVR